MYLIGQETMTEETLDLTSGSENAHFDRLTEAFHSLQPGGVLFFITAEPPRKIVRQLTQSIWGQFDWAPLSEDDPQWLSQIVKRTQPGPATLEEMLSADHRRCDDLFAAAESAAQEGDQARCEMLFGRLDLGMERHFRIEEEGFFPQVDQRMGLMGGGPVAVMRNEHQQIRGLLRRMSGALAGGNLEEFLAASDTMIYLMEQHNMKEEQMLYPMADDAFGGELDELLQRLFLF